jgi:hypothetical protein
MTPNHVRTTNRSRSTCCKRGFKDKIGIKAHKNQQSIRVSFTDWLFDMKILLKFFVTVSMLSAVWGQLSINGSCPSQCKPYELNVTADDVLRIL